MDQKQRVLKLVVIGLGLAIAACLVIIIIGIGMNVARMGAKKPAAAPAAETGTTSVPASAQRPAIGNVDVPVPYGARVAAVTGGHGEFHVLVDTPEGRSLVIVDRATGGVLGTLRFVPGSLPARPAP